MPLVIEWFSSENNSVSDLLVTSLQQNPDVEAAGMKINQTVGTFTDLLTYYYDNSTENPYQMFNLATGFGNLMMLHSSMSRALLTTPTH